MSAPPKAPPEHARDAVIRVGDGRGFVAEVPHHLYGAERVVITAAHCLPELPPAHPMSYTRERTYENLLGQLGEEPSVWAECYFADPVADVAILGAPDNQALYEVSEVYEKLIEGRPTLPLRMAVDGEAWLLGLDGEWYPCRVRVSSRGHIHNAGPTQPGMSGSPILQDGAAVGVVSTNSLNPSLAHLPGWATRTVWDVAPREEA